MGIADLTGPRAKLGWANEHFHAADSEMRRYIEQDPEAGRVQLWYEAPWYVVRFNSLLPFPLRTALILGDCINNIRAVLDHLVWQLVLREDQEPGKHHCFPICETPEDFINEVELPAQRSKKRSPLYGIPVNGDAWAIIKRAQPFQCREPKYQPLLWIAQLNNIDKHRTLLVQRCLVDVQMVVSQLRWEPDLQPIEQRIPALFLPTEEPAELARFRFAEGVGMRVQVNDYTAGEPTIGDREHRVSMGILTLARLQVEQILDQVSALPRVQG